MAVKSNEIGNELIWTITNGERQKIQQVMEKYNFLDHQSFLRFAITILALNEGKSIPIMANGMIKEVIPAPDLIKNALTQEDKDK